ncbi:DUF4132 domain-containing protein [Kibdelosporangium philippinense]|uniref:DUF4132 domain-containing protein n=1 Tax=Kibdelosporangium philippinense TaxID=211113 RepID=A0ABS8Z7G7_9PSEU|nr:DUF4132 domain-containing protein [Kibdelosporangium philippinense]MCE7003831.1 DUF4132 domain-containing protein [Kibdelosporangium philippinense]
MDENTFEMPAAWRRHTYPRRDRGTPAFQPDNQEIAKGAALLESLRTGLDEVFDEPRSDKTLADAGRAYLAGEPMAIGAAVVRMTASATRMENVTPLVHHWIAEHGVVFAAEAALSCPKVQVSVDYFSMGAKSNRGSAAVWVEPQSTTYSRRNHREVTVGTKLLRRALAAASEAEYAAAEAKLDSLGGFTSANVIRAYLMPTRSDWVSEALQETVDLELWWLLAYSVSTPEDLAILPRTHAIGYHADLVYTVLDAVGTAIVPRLAEELDGYNDIDMRKRSLAILAAIPTDEAFTAMLDRLAQDKVQSALVTAMRAFPQRAARLLAARANDDIRIRGLLEQHLRANPDLELPEKVRAIADTLDLRAESVPVAPADLLPPLLVDPPWKRPTKQVKQVVVTGLDAPEPVISWAPGEREQWAAVRGYWDSWCDDDWPKNLEVYRQGKQSNSRTYNPSTFFARGPEEMIRPLLAGWSPPSYSVDEWGKVIVAKYGLDALPAMMRIAPTGTLSSIELLLPYASIEVAEVMADRFCNRKSVRRVAMDWLIRHGVTAARMLIPAALGAAGDARKNAEAALRFIATQGHDLVAAASEFGTQAQDGIRTLVEVDLIEVLPAKLPKLGAWADPKMMPQVRMRDGQHALPPDAVGHLLMTMALSKPGDVYAGLPIVRDMCDPSALSSFAWSVFELWLQADSPSKDSWALHALGWFGDDDTVRTLSPLIRRWPGESQHQRAVTGLDVLAEIGSEVALAHLNGIAEKVKFKALKARAREKVAAIAAQLGLSRDQLADRLVPRLGLDEATSLTIDYGTRTFTVGFDEQLKPYVVDADGKRRKDLPKPGAKDDQELSKAEYKRYAALKKDVRTVASDQIHRLETALVNQRTWTATEFHDLLAGHPLLWHIVRRLVWMTDAGHSFRLAEDRTLANAEDDIFLLPGDAEVRLAHPVLLDAETLAAWGEVFADYEILQPFPQLGRPVANVDSLPAALAQYTGAVVPVGKLLGLTKRGWERGQPQDAGVECWILRPLPSGGAIAVGLEPGIAAGAVNEYPEQKLAGLTYSPSGTGYEYWSSTATNVPDLDQVTVSEILSELASLID